MVENNVSESSQSTKIQEDLTIAGTTEPIGSNIPLVPDAFSFHHLQVLDPTLSPSMQIVLSQEWEAYINSVSVEDTAEIDLVKYWKEKQSVYPYLSKLAQSFIWL